MSIISQFNLSGRVVVITGGYGYLGMAMVRGAAEAGATTIIAGRRLDRAKEAAEEMRRELPDAILDAVQMDVSNTSSVKATFEQVCEKHGPLYGLINNAYFCEGGLFNEMSDEAWAIGMEGSVNSVFRCMREALPHFDRQAGGVIVNVSSMYGMVSPDFAVYEGNPDAINPVNYGAGKAAILQLTRYGANWLAPRGIRVNSLTPGAFPQPPSQKNKQFIKNLSSHIPLGRPGQPEELTGAAIFLLSDASSYMTGQNLVIDGGWTSR